MGGDIREMTRNSAISELRQLEALKGDTEVAHQLADDILCDLLDSIGCGAVVVEYKKINKWYA